MGRIHSVYLVLCKRFIAGSHTVSDLFIFVAALFVVMGQSYFIVE